jgi:Ca-activated chloride channel homolog
MTFKFSPLLTAARMVVIAVVIGVQIVGLTVGAAQASEEAMLIFDASRSMWGQIDGKNRIVIARQVLGKVFQRYESRLKLGIMAYGNRSSSNCRDVNHIKPVGRIRAAAYTKAIQSINPRGKTPIARAIRLGAAKLDYKNKKATLILMSDGLDNCYGNPCAMAKKLEEGANFLTIHVVAFSVPKEDRPGLACIARNTGGRFFVADNGSELSTAFDSIVEEISATNVPFTVAAAPQISLEKDKQAAVEDEADVETRKLLEALKARSQKNSEIENSQPSQGRTTRTIGNGALIEPSNRSEIAGALAENPIKPAVLLVNKEGKKGSEGLELVARLASNSPPLTTNIKWEIYNFIKSSNGNRAQILTSDVARPNLPLAPGKYIVRAVFGVSSTAKVIEISPAKITGATFVLNTGGIRVKPLLIAGNPPAGKVPRQWIYLSSTPQYPNRARFIATADDPNQIHQLNAGTYELVSKFGTANAIVKTNVTVSPGLLTEVEISHKAGIVRFKLFKKWRGGEELKDVVWKLFDDEGNEVASNLAASSGEIIAPGRYKVSAKYNDNTYTKMFRIKPGRTKLVQVVAR